MRIDLHVHSNASDGTDDPAEVIRRAAEAGVDVVALTDHDTVAGWGAAKAAAKDAGADAAKDASKGAARAAGAGEGAGGAGGTGETGGARETGEIRETGGTRGAGGAKGGAPGGVTLIPGAELSCQLNGRSVHLLCYLFDPGNAELAKEMSLIRDDRTFRAKGMIAKLNELGASVTWEQVARIADGAVVGRPHIARAMAESRVVETPADAFTEWWIADGGRAYVERYAVTLDRAVRLVREAGGVPVLAHPRSPGYEIPDEVIATLAATGLAGIEVNHPDHDAAQRSGLARLAGDLGLLITGGSDDHGSFVPSGARSAAGTWGGIGSETTPDEEYEKLVSLGNVRPGTAE